ncbi:hypothetical protein BKA93DRAFT_828567 [Sparassis latifolia]
MNISPREHSAQSTSTKQHYLSYPSLDPPGKVRSDLVVPFMPTARKIPREKAKEIVDLPPFDTLPRILIPSSKLQLKPPVMHYGWIANESLLMEYAKEHKVPILRRPNLKRKTNVHEELYFEEEAPRRTAVDLDPEKDRMAYVALLKDVVVRLLRELNISWPRRMLVMARPLAAGCPLIVSLYTNYDLARAPPPEVIEALRVRLEEKEQPKWFLSSSDWKWSRSGPRQ